MIRSIDCMLCAECTSLERECCVIDMFYVHGSLQDINIFQVCLYLDFLKQLLNVTCVEQLFESLLHLFIETRDIIHSE